MTDEPGYRRPMFLSSIFVLACAARHARDTAAHDTARDPALDTASDSGDPGGHDSAPSDSADDSGAAPDSGDTDDSGQTDTGERWIVCDDYATASSTGRVSDTSLEELSGLVVSRKNPGVLWAHEDSGNPAQLVALDTAGSTLATIDVAAENVDWEDLAVAPCGDDWCLWIGDIGDLGAGREDFALLRVPEPDLATWAGDTLVPEVFPFRYPDTPQDAEGLAIFADGTPLVVTKRSDATAGLYALHDGESLLEHLADVATGSPSEDLSARATAADLDPSGTRLLVRAYLHLREFDVTDPRAPVLLGERPFGLEVQGEAVAYDPIEGGYRQVAEGNRPALYHVPCDDGSSRRRASRLLPGFDD
jgi:hypothetical protein